MRREFLKLLIVGLMLAELTACSPTIRWPRWVSPGTAPLQRYSAEQFDPYPQNDMGPEIVGGRPPDYQIQVPEVNRARMGMPVGVNRTGQRY
jgi:hypothetical protein